MAESVLSQPVVPPALPSAQDAFLNHARRTRVPVTVRLLDGVELQGRLTGFDRFAIVVDVEGVDQLIFKHAIATVVALGSTPRPEGRT